MREKNAALSLFCLSLLIWRLQEFQRQKIIANYRCNTMMPAVKNAPFHELKMDLRVFDLRPSKKIMREKNAANSVWKDA